MKKIIVAICITFFSFSNVQGQKKDSIVGKATLKRDVNDNLLIKIKEGANPVIYVDDKIFDFPMELIDPNKIASVTVIKDEEALKKYNAPNGVVFIKTKEASKNYFSDKTITKDNKIGGKNGPMVIVDGKLSSQEIIQQLSPRDIESINVLKGEKAIKQYNAPNGVIIIKTKKRD